MRSPRDFSGAEVVPMVMLYLVVVLLFGHVFGALQFGSLYRHQKLNRVVKTESNTLIDISVQGYGAMLQLEDAGLKVPSIYGMNILVVPKQGKMKTPDTNNVIKVRQDDIILIYSGTKFQRNRYSNTAAENLKTRVEDDVSALVFGVMIQSVTAPKMKATPIVSNCGFADRYIQNLDKNRHVVGLNCSSFIILKDKNIRLTAAVHPNGVEALVEGGGVGALIRDGSVIERFGSTQKLVSCRAGDVVLIMLPEMQTEPLQRNKKRQLLDQAISLVQQGNRLLLGQTFPGITSFVATIVDNVPNYLEDATIIGDGTIQGRNFFIQDTSRFNWWFEENTIQGYLGQTSFIHIRNGDIKNDVERLAANINAMGIDDDTIHFDMDRFKSSYLQSRDIIIFIVGEEGVEKICVSAIKHALSGCKTSADLKIALNGLKLHPATAAMAAFVSDKIPPSKMKMTSLTTNEPANVAYAKTLATWSKSDKEIQVSLPSGGVGTVSASIVFTDRNKVSIRQIGGAVALIIDKDGGLKYGPNVAFGNTHRPVHLELGSGVADHDNLKVEHGDTVMVILPLSVGGIKWKPFEIAATAHDFDTMDEHLKTYLQEGQTAVIAARIERELPDESFLSMIL